MTISTKFRFHSLIFFGVAATFMLSGCATPVRHAGGKTPTLAIIAGVPDDANRAIVAAVTESFQRQSRQALMTEVQIAQKLGSYPQYIQGPYQRAYFEIEADWGRSDTTKIANIQRALGVDYLYVIWVPNAIRNGALADYLVWTQADIKAVDINEVEAPVVAQLFALPGSRVVMKSEYKLHLDGAYKPGSLPFRDSIDSIARKLGEESGLMKGWW